MTSDWAILSSVKVPVDKLSYSKCAGSSGAVHSVFLIDVYLDLENPGGSGFWVGENRRVTGERVESVCKHQGTEVDGSWHRGGCQVSKQGEQGEQREQGEQGEQREQGKQGKQGEQGEQRADLVHKSETRLVYVCNEWKIPVCVYNNNNNRNECCW